MENKNDVKGGLVIEQMRRYVKRLSDHTGNSVNIRIEVWHHPDTPNMKAHTSVDFILWDAARSRFIEIQYPDEDLRSVGKRIDEIIVHEFTGHLGE
jgi:hypothetical protein